MHMLKVGLFIFLLLIACIAENSIAHDHQDIDCQKSKYVYDRLILIQ